MMCSASFNNFLCGIEFGGYINSSYGELIMFYKGLFYIFSILYSRL